MFGYCNSSAIFQRISDAVHDMLHRHQFDVVNYIDYILGIDIPSKIDASFDGMCHLLHVLGFNISLKKLERTSTHLNCLGILVDTENFTVSKTSPKNRTNT